VASSFAGKFQIKAGNRVLLMSAPPEVRAAFSDLPSGASLVTRPRAGGCDVVFLFARTLAELDTRLPAALDALSADGCLWVARYKKAAKVDTDVLEPTVRERGRQAGLRDVMVRAVGVDWSALKFAR
jgi:hypothetical protein